MFRTEYADGLCYNEHLYNEPPLCVTTAEGSRHFPCDRSATVMPVDHCTTPQIVCDDVLRWAEKTAPIGAHALLADPPYHLSGGFMGAGWDKDGPDAIAFRPETWAALARHLLPGAFIMAFASSRGWHRLACAMEDAGLRIYPSIFAWANGSSFPKATQVEADGWAGHRYGGQILKNAIEPIIVAQVPYAGTPVDSITATGAGALWIEGARIATTEIGQSREPDPLRKAHPDWRMTGGSTGGGASSPGGRWPANFCLQHLPACQPLGTKSVPGTNIPGPGARSVGYSGCEGGLPHIQQYAAPDGTETVQAYACADGCPVAALDAQAGERTSGSIAAHHQRHGKTTVDVYGTFARPGTVSYGDTGPASRFFYTADWSLDVAEQLAQANSVYYCGKASPAERQEGLGGRNTHPTVKPLSLCTWLATLLLPPAAYAPRRLLVPFAGTGSEMVGGILAGWETVLGIERELPYVEIGRKRLAWWTGYTVPSPDVVETSQQATTVPPASGQLNLFG
jgi:DNA modification methylase